MAAKGFAPTLLNGDIPLPTAPGAYAERVNEEITALWARAGLSADRTYYVRSDGNDANDGLTDSAGGAFLTFAAAIAAVGKVCTFGFTITIRMKNATWTAPLLVPEGVLLYGGNYVFEGNTASPSSCVISISSALNACIDIKDNPGVILVKGFKLTSSNSGTLGLYAQNNTKVYYRDMQFGALTGGGSAQISAVSGAKIYCAGDNTINGDAGYHVYCDDASYVSLGGAADTLTITGARTFTAFAWAHGPGTVHGSAIGAITLGGGASFTGLRAKVDLGGLVDTGTVTFPGTGSAVQSGIFNETVAKTGLPSGSHTAALATFQSTATAAGAAIASFSDNNRDSFTIYANNDGTGYNAANAVAKIRQANATGRSINAAGTLNASGADYAEYEFKRDDCGAFEKGAIVGFDKDGLLTDKWSLAVSFGVKSTNPAYVGGDMWGRAEDRCPIDGKPIGEPPLCDPEPVAGDEKMADSGAFKLLHEQWSLRYQAWAVSYAAWSDRLEAARSRVDRVAYCGKVPVNVRGVKPGDYIDASKDAGDRIAGSPSKTPGPNTVGRVRRVLPDGRALIAVT